MAAWKFDRFELKILQLLQQDGRTQISEMAEKTGLSATPCARRFDALMQTGVIRGIHARLSRRAIGLNIEVFIQITLMTHAGDTPERFKAKIAGFPEVTACWALTGEQDFLLNVVVPDVDALNHFVMETIRKIDGVRDVKTNLVLENVKPEGAMPLSHLMSTD